VQSIVEHAGGKADVKQRFRCLFTQGYHKDMQQVGAGLALQQNLDVVGYKAQWTLVNPALVNPVLGLTRSKTQGTNHSEPDQTELDNPVLWLIRSKSKGDIGDRINQSPL
jgi:hypothetical protein